MTKPRNSRGRRLASFEELRNDYDYDDDHDIGVEQDIVAIPTTTTSDQSKSAADENVFKVPGIPRRKSVRKSKSVNFKGKENHTNDSIANEIPDADVDDAAADADVDTDTDTNENENASTSRQRDSLDISVRIEPMNDSSIQAYMTENDASLPNPPNTSSTKNKAPKPKTARRTKARPKTRPKRVQNTGVSDDEPTLPRRRQSRDSHYSNNFLAEYLKMVKAPTLAPKRKLKSTSTAPVTNRRAEQGPPKKKLRTEPEIPHKAKRPTDVVEPLKKSGKSMTSNKTKSKPNQSTSSSNTKKSAKSMAASGAKTLADFVTGLDEKRMKASEFWKDINDYDKDNEVLGEDMLYIRTKEGTIGE